MSGEIPGILLIVVLLFGHLIATSFVTLATYALLNIARLQPDISYLFWPGLIGGTIAWAFTARKILVSSTPFSWWYESAFTWYAILLAGGFAVGILIQRSKM